MAWHGRCRVVACSVLIRRAPTGFGDATPDQVRPSGGYVHAGDPSGRSVVPPWMGFGMGLICLEGCRNAEDYSGGSVVPHLTGGGDCHSPVRSDGDLVALEGLSLLELLAACSRYGVSKEGDQLVFRRRLADYLLLHVRVLVRRMNVGGGLAR